MQKIQSQGIHHISLIGADRQSAIDFWEGVLGMPFVFEQPNLENANDSHLFFDPGDGRLITVFTNEARKPEAKPSRTRTQPGAVHHIAISVSGATLQQAAKRLEARGIRHSGIKDRGFMDSLYFREPLGLTIELSAYRFVPPAGFTHVEVLIAAHHIRVARGDHAIGTGHLADAIERLTERQRESLSPDRSARNPWRAPDSD